MVDLAPLSVVKQAGFQGGQIGSMSLGLLAEVCGQ